MTATNFTFQLSIRVARGRWLESTLCPPLIPGGGRGEETRRRKTTVGYGL